MWQRDGRTPGTENVRQILQDNGLSSHKLPLIRPKRQRGGRIHPLVDHPGRTGFDQLPPPIGLTLRIVPERPLSHWRLPGTSRVLRRPAGGKSSPALESLQFPRQPVQPGVAETAEPRRAERIPAAMPAGCPSAGNTLASNGFSMRSPSRRPGRIAVSHRKFRGIPGNRRGSCIAVRAWEAGRLALLPLAQL